MEQNWTMKGGGTLTLQQDGPRVRLVAQRPSDGRGLYKVWLKGERGKRFLLGTLAPEGKMLRLQRTVSSSELERAGCWPPTGVEAPLSFSFPAEERWYREQDPQRLVSDRVISGQIKGAMLCRKETDGFFLAAPFRPEGPVALESIICLAQMEQMEGRPHLVWKFDRAGRPKIPNKSKQDWKD